MIIGGDNNLVLSYDISTHELIDIWDVQMPVSALATYDLKGGNFVMAAGTDKGQIVLR